MIVNSIYSFVLHEMKFFPYVYFDMARKLAVNMETESSIMNSLTIIFGFLIMFGGIAFFISAAIIILPLILLFTIIVIISERI